MFADEQRTRLRKKIEQTFNETGLRPEAAGFALPRWPLDSGWSWISVLQAATQEGAPYASWKDERIPRPRKN